jgi:hypothetical protein
VDWRHIAAVGEHSMSDALALWTRVREAADDELYGSHTKNRIGE